MYIMIIDLKLKGMHCSTMFSVLKHWHVWTYMPLLVMVYFFSFPLGEGLFKIQIIDIRKTFDIQYLQFTIQI